MREKFHGYWWTTAAPAALGLGLAAVGIGGGGRAAIAAEAKGPLLEADGANIRNLLARLAAIPRCRDFLTGPTILDDPAFWDDPAIWEIMAYGPVTKQVWDNTVIEGPWLNLIRNSLSAQVWSFKHPDSLVVSATHGSADRGGVFMACHNAIWEQAAKRVAMDLNPDRLLHQAVGMCAALYLTLSAIAATATTAETALDQSVFPQWQHGANIDAIRRGLEFTVPEVDDMADFHGDPGAPKLVHFVGGNSSYATGPTGMTNMPSMYRGRDVFQGT